ncbi:MAG: isoleucine--tRNA ligase [bacterium]|nr:isoleucine--tRNA ligase [bacterium]
MQKFKPVSSQVNFAELEENIIKFWKEDRTFEKSVEKEAPNGDWNFLDGPPFITGMPHYGNILPWIPKDIFPRYWTMKGFRVRRVWGWDCHGLPAENKVEQQLGITRKKDIEEKIGVKKFIYECKLYVNNVSSEWEWYVDHIGRWVDFKNAYKTMDLSYMETVMWVFKQMYEKNLIYKGLRVSLFCPHCSTPISNFEVAMDADNYKDLIESTAVYKYPLKNEKNTFLLAWSTTPWNKLVTSALAINPKLTYVKVSQGDENYILAKGTVKMLQDKPFTVLEEFKGSELIGKEFVPLYDFYEIEPGKKAFIVVGDEFVTGEEGTGVVTLAPYGEEDLALMQKENIQMVLHVDDEGMVRDFVPKFGGMYYLKADKLVLEDLKERGFVYRIDEYTHSVPHCWRCATRLFYAPQDAWFVNVQVLKEQLKKTNEEVNWFPKHFKHGRFLKSLEAAPDWNISRSRYWGSPVPVWECECGERFVPGSIVELEERSGKKITDLHKPDIDEVTVKCGKCGKLVKRVPEVLDSWTEAGSAPFAERHFPFNTEIKLEEFFPPDFIVEYTGQIRAWFYVLHVISAALFDSNAFKNAMVTGVLLGTDGRKMSKNFGNYPDPKVVLKKYGGDAMRVYFMGVPIMKGEDINFSEEGVAEAYRFMLVFWNTYKFFVEYANLSDWKPGGERKLTVLDRWILSRLTRLISGLRKAYEGYNTNDIVKYTKEFILYDFSTWYIRRSRDRVDLSADLLDRNTSLSVMHEVLVTVAKLAAPLIPFITEEMFKGLTDEESVHLQGFPEVSEELLDEDLMKDMVQVRKIAEVAHSKRKEAGIKLRQPLASILYKLPKELDDQLEKILAEEINVKKVEYQKSSAVEPEVNLDTKITQVLKEEGEARDLIRQIQQLRKEQGLTLSDKIKIIVASWPKAFEKQILTGTASVSIEEGSKLKVLKV